MAEDVGQAYVGIVPSLKGFSAKLRAELAGELRGIDAPIADAGHRAGGSFGDRMREGIRSRLAGIGAMLKTGLVVGVAGAAAGLGALTTFGLKSAAALEQTQIGIEALVGSTEEATKFLGEIQAFAAKTPFEFQGVADASRRILAFGNAVGITRDEVLPTITVIGDLVSVLGGSQESIDSVVRALGQISSKGKVSQEELLQLAEALPGFNANAAIAAALGLDVGESMEAITRGEVDATTGINALLAGMQQFPGAAGAMEKQSKTLLGVWSTFKDTIAIALTNAFQPVIPEIKQTLSDITPVLGEAISALAPVLGKLLAVVLPAIAGVVEVLTPILMPFLDALAETIPALAPAFKPLGVAFGKIAEALAPLLPVLGEVIGTLALSLAPVIESLAPVIAELAKPIGDVLLALIPILPPLGQLIALAVEAQVPLWQLVGALVSLLANEAVAQLIQLLADGLAEVVKFAKPIIEFSNSLDALNTNIGGLWQIVQDAWPTIVGAFEGLPGRIGEALSALPGLLQEKARTAFNDMAFAVGEGVGRVLRFFIDLPGNVVDAAKEFGPQLLAFAVASLEQFKTSVRERLDDVLGFFRDLPGRAKEFLSSLPGKLAEAAQELWPKAMQLGRDIVEGVRQGIVSTIGSIGSTLKEGFDNAVAGVKRGLGIASPSKVFAEIGENTVAGYVQGIEQSARDAAMATTAALSPAATSTVAAPAAPQRVAVDSGDALIDAALARIKERIRQLHGGDVDLALASTSL